MTGPAGLVVVGAGQAAAQLAMSLRQKGYDAPITLVGDEPHLPYERPPLSKAHLGTESRDTPSTDDELLLRPATFWAAKDVTIHTGRTVVGIDRVARAVTLDAAGGGGILRYDHLVLATGAAPRRVAGADLAGVHVLRTRDDADRLRAELADATDVVVVGAGFIGLEVAAAARKRGAAVTLLEMTGRAMGRVVSERTAAGFVDEHRRHGVDVRFGTGLAAVLGDGAGQVRAVVPHPGVELPCDVLVLGVGVEPRTELAEAAGLTCRNGIAVDATLRTGDPWISAIGDCAAFPSVHAGGVEVRLEAVQNAVDHARCVADRITGSPRPYTAVPWFWTHQYDLKLQVAGLVTGYDTAVLRGDPATGSYSVFCFAGTRLLGVESVNRPADHLLARALLAGDHSLTPDVVADPDADLAGYRPRRQLASAERTTS
jgi:3-phenylpropionate/trans-cinnamate dioxygenase ferredoxin reductase subunit